MYMIRGVLKVGIYHSASGKSSVKNFEEYIYQGEAMVIAKIEST
jgi:hypothetical protein